VVGDTPGVSRTDVGYFAPGTPMASDAGLSALTTRRDPAAAAAAIKAAGYQGEKVVVMTPSDYPRIDALCNVGADLLKRCGLNVELQATDWGTVIQRRASKAPPGQGGWSVFVTTLTGADMGSPASSVALRGNGAGAWFGWPSAPGLERLREQWLSAPTLADQKRIAAAIQAQAFVDVPYLPLGQFFQPTATNRSLTGVLQGMPLFWSVQRRA
jgi:peptide/nickel transport system substrate-binding protein